MRISDWSSDVCSSDLDVVDQKQDVLVGFVTEMLGDGERRQTRPQTRARWLIPLPEDERGAFEHTRLPELKQQLIALTRALTDAGEDRDAGVPLERRADQLHDQDGLDAAGASAHGGIAAF